MLLIYILIISIYKVYCQNAFLKNPDPALLQEYINAITAYGPGLGVFSPYSYVDISYDNIPFVGKIPIFGKEGTSSKLGISPFYPPEGNPSNPFPPLYRARPLPLHVPEPQDVVAVPLDEEALHGEPLFPPELTLPGEKAQQEKEQEIIEKPEDPFNESEQTETPEGFVNWKNVNEADDMTTGVKNVKGETTIMDMVSEKNAKPEEIKKISFERDHDHPKSPFRTKRIRRWAIVNI